MRLARSHVTLSWLFTCCAVTGTFSASYPTNTVDAGVQLLEAGDLPSAERTFQLAVSEARNTSHSLDEAIAHKWLGVTQARYGAARLSEATNELRYALDQLLPLAAMDNSEAQQQVAFANYDLAEVLRFAAESVLREQRLYGVTPEAYFSIVQKYVSPAEDAIARSVRFYPTNLVADIACSRGEQKLLLARLHDMFLPGSDTSTLYQEAVGEYRSAIATERCEGPSARQDLLTSAAIRIAEISLELSQKDGPTTQAQLAARSALEDLNSIEGETSPHAELNAHLLYVRSMCSLRAVGTNIPSETAANVESELLMAADLVESMRHRLKGRTSFETLGSFFSQRTHVYEALGELYARVNQPERMLAAIERMKARTFHSMLASEAENHFDLPRLQDCLRQDNAGLVEFFYGPEHAWALWVTSTASVEIIELPISGQSLVVEMQKMSREFSRSKDRRAWMRMLNNTMRPGEQAAMLDGYRAANRLWEVILRPVVERADSAGVGRLYVVPHHMMHYLSFNSLVTNLNESNLLTSEFFVERGRPVTYLPSSASLLELQSEPSQSVTKSYIFARSDFHSVTPTFPADLAGTITEARMVERTTMATLFLERHASETQLRLLTGPYGLLYFATHGVLNGQRPMDSAILLADSTNQASFDDGRVTVRELLTDFRGKLGADLTVLSACHTNEGEPNPSSGDDFAALSRGFIVAGARSVVATQWEASDGTFPTIMGLFLEAWTKQGRPKDEALASALRSFLAQNDFPIWRHPHFWASVVMLGAAK